MLRVMPDVYKEIIGFSAKHMLQVAIIPGTWLRPPWSLMEGSRRHEANISAEVCSSSCWLVQSLGRPPTDYQRGPGALQWTSSEIVRESLRGVLLSLIQDRATFCKTIVVKSVLYFWSLCQKAFQIQSISSHIDIVGSNSLQIVRVGVGVGVGVHRTLVLWCQHSS